MPQTAPRSQKDVTLQATLNRLNKTLDEFTEKNVRISHPGRSLGLHFLRGLVYGLGILTAMVIVIPVAIEILRIVEWVPLIGDFIVEIVKWIESVNELR